MDVMMERSEALVRPECDAAEGRGLDHGILPSRRSALRALQSAIVAARGPVLLSGEPGAGKTWLAGKLRATSPSSWRWLTLDLSPALDPMGLYTLMLDAMGCEPCATLALARAAIAESLEAGAADRVSWGLVLDECHTACTGVLEEVRVLSNSLGRSRGFAAIVLVAQPALLRRLTTQSLAALKSRLERWTHLRPLELEELRIWLTTRSSETPWSDMEVERLHRDTFGNPARVMRHPLWRATAARRPAPAPILERPPTTTPPPSKPATPVEHRSEAAAIRQIGSVLPSKPPLLVADDMIEVGWVDDPDDIPTTPEAIQQPAPAQVPRPTSEPVVREEPIEVVRAKVVAEPVSPSEEMVEDHYAALQAWSEWSRHQPQEVEEAASTRDPFTDERVEPGDASGGEPVEEPLETPARSGGASVWAEGQHGFAPYSQLFSRLRMTRDTP